MTQTEAGFTLRRGTTPLLVSLPHVGTEIAPDIAARLLPHALAVPDTDWHLERLYAFAHDELGASLIVPRWSRYCVDLNPRLGIRRHKVPRRELDTL